MSEPLTNEQIECRIARAEWYGNRYYEVTGDAYVSSLRELLIYRHQQKQFAAEAKELLAKIEEFVCADQLDYIELGELIDSSALPFLRKVAREAAEV